MPDEDRYFCLVFLQCEGNMKDVEKVMGISYPTIKNRLAQIRSALGTPVQSPDSGGNRRENPAGGDREKVREVLRTLEQGEIAFDKALDLIKGGQTKGEGS
jgi:hypothetical protein